MISSSYDLEHGLISKHNKKCLIVGIDEVGRGALAGPVYAAAVCMYFDNCLKGKIKENIIINDSKKLTFRRRINSYNWLLKNIYTYGIGSASVEEINKYGITSATVSVFNRAVVDLMDKTKNRVDYVLIDGNKYLSDGLNVNCVKQTIKGGDGKVMSISAASIIAKVTRDNYMKNLASNKNFTYYRWDKNKGYGTKEHIEAIKKFGITTHHRQWGNK